MLLLLNSLSASSLPTFFADSVGVTDGLVDELHLYVYPLTRGSGPRLFPDGAAPRKLSLARRDSYDNGVVYLAYRPETAG